MFSALLVSQNAGRRQTLTSAALTTNQLMLARILEDYPAGIALTRLLHVVEPEIVLLDLAGGDDALVFAQAVRATLPELPVLGFSDTPGPVHTGGPLDVVLTYPPAPEELGRFVSALVRRSVFRVKENLLLFLPAKAGSGTSTIVWNTAASLAGQGARRVLAIEADYRSGALSLQFDEKPEGSFQSLLLSGRELDGLQIESAALARNGVTLLLSDRTAVDPEPPWEVYARLIEAATSRYDPVLIDLPENPTPGLWELVRRAGAVFLVATPDVVALKMAARACSELDRHGIDPGRVRVVLNRWDDGDLSRSHVEDFLHHPVAHVFPSEKRAIRTAMLRGEPVPQWSESWKNYRAFANLLTTRKAAPSQTLGGRLMGAFSREAHTA